MGFLDKAKAKIVNGLGEETVRLVNYDEDEEQKTPREPKKKSEPKEKPQRAPKEPRGVKLPRKRAREADSSEEEEVFIPDSVEAPVQEDTSTFFSPQEESVFAVDDEGEDYFTEQQRKYDAAMAERFNGVPEVKVQNNEIQDVLDVLGIAPTFAIERDILLPEDVDEASTFDLQAPYGFEQGQVSAFVEKTRVSVERYVSYLKQRNEDVAKLATVVDRLQVDMNNLKFQTEISNGINVMPTSDSDDMESKYMEARLTIKRLEDQLKTMEGGDNLSTGEREKFDALQDQVSILQRENESLQEENYGLKNRLAYLEEAADDEPAPPPQVEEVGELPEVSEELPPRSTTPSKPSPSSAFYTPDDEEEEEEEESSIFLLDDNGGASKSTFTYSEEDEEDPLDSLMRDWNKN